MRQWLLYAYSVEGQSEEDMNVNTRVREIFGPAGGRLPMLLGPDQDQDQDCLVPHVAGECVPCLLDWCWRDTEQAITTAMHAGALDVVGRRLVSCTRTPPRADARNRRTARRQPGTPSARRPPRESRGSGTRLTVCPAVNTDNAMASTTEPTFTVLAPAVRRPCRASSGYNAQLTNTHDAAADVRHTLTNASDASTMT